MMVFDGRVVEYYLVNHDHLRRRNHLKDQPARLEAAAGRGELVFGSAAPVKPGEPNQFLESGRS
jgi:hypothetical protein